MGAPKTASTKKPDVVDFHDYRAFLKAWFAYSENSDPDFSLRALAQNAGLGASTLSMILNGSRSLSTSLFESLAPHLKLGIKELHYLELLRTLSDGATPLARTTALTKIQKTKEYKRRHPKEFETFHYLSHWYYAAIREMAALPDFQYDAEWIQSRLRDFIPISEIESALEFLIANEFLDPSQPGTPPKPLSCIGGVFSVALGTFHKQMLSKAAESIDTVASQDRLILGHTLAIPAAQAEEARQILSDALAKIEKLNEKPGAPDTVYHVELALIPLSKSQKKGEDQ